MPVRKRVRSNGPDILAEPVQAVRLRPPRSTADKQADAARSDWLDPRTTTHDPFKLLEVRDIVDEAGVVRRVYAVRDWVAALVQAGHLDQRHADAGKRLGELAEGARLHDPPVVSSYGRGTGGKPEEMSDAQAERWRRYSMAVGCMPIEHRATVVDVFVEGRRPLRPELLRHALDMLVRHFGLA